jgi:CxxC motif-containing protein (DUF1111 family)
MFARCVWRRWTWCAAAAATLFSLPLFAAPPNSDGRQLFEREWIPRDPRSHSGDGLGPLFNDTSCIACHNQGGAGGGGAKSKNAQIVSVISSKNTFKGDLSAEEIVQRERELLQRIHAGFAHGRGVVLHRSSTDDHFAATRYALLGIRPAARSNEEAMVALAQGEMDSTRRRSAEVNGFGFTLSERNTTALFGSGAIDAIPDDLLLAAAEARFEDFPEVSGRVSKLQGGKLGRFGWKAQTATLNEFVRTACAVEIGLEVPGIPQASYKAAQAPLDDLFEKAFPEKETAKKKQALDLTQKQCDALAEYVGSLPAPRERIGGTPQERHYLASGYELFHQTGCAACHWPRLGEAVGLYSDLLLHDMGSGLADGAAYYNALPNSTEEQESAQPLARVSISKLKQPVPVDETKLIGALRQEWRTPPLWGVRDSAPYLHDGRADTLEQAIALHAGEAQRSTERYAKLTAAQRLQLTTFLKSLEAPR